MSQRNIYSGAPKDARCPDDGGFFVDTELRQHAGLLPSGDRYNYQVAVEKKCNGCGRIWRRKDQAA